MTIEPGLAIQRSIRARLISDPAVTALVPPERIFDGRWRTENMPCVIIGEGNVLYSDEYESFHEEAYLDVHVWTREEGFELARQITGAIRAALKQAPWTSEDHIVHGITVSKARFIRGREIENAHAIVSVDAIMQATA
jgi:hypothetical protein